MSMTDRRMRNQVVESGDFTSGNKPKIAPLTNSRELFEVYALAHDYYVNKGYANPQADGILVQHPEFDLIPETRIFLAYFQEELVGTISITLDGKKGLPLKKTYPNTYAVIQTGGRHMAESWRLIVKTSCPQPERVAEALLNKAAEQLLADHVQTCFLSTVPPEHIAVCRESLNTVLLVGNSLPRGTSGSSCALLRWDVENLPKHWRDESLTKIA